MLIRIGLCGADGNYLENLEQVINGTVEFETAFRAKNISQLLALSTEHPPDIIILDVNLPLLNGKHAIQLLKDEYPSMKFLITMDSEDEDLVFSMLLEGADGFILKTACAELFREGIKELSQGKACLTQSMLHRLVARFKTDQPDKKDYHLSYHEMRILKCLVKGDSYKMISDTCNISIGTVRYHINHLYRKMLINSKSEAVAKALLESIIPLATLEHFPANPD
jgi:DNA-binding NarL/FixJ family response regulator